MGRESDTQIKPDREKLEARILNSLQGEIEPTEPSTLYKVGLMLVAGGMMFLPIVYLLLIGGLGYSLIALITSDTKSGGLHVLFLIFGTILLLFMIKPMFAKRAKQQTPKALKREAEPFIYEYVEWVCDLVGAPVPGSIRVDCNVNAAAGFRHGFASMFSNDLTLVIGLPLVSGLTLRQFTAILAHEFGHFSQGTAMRLGYIINTINAWFARVVYERDAWDEKLNDLERMTFRLKIFVWPCQLMIFLTRFTLKLLMYAGHSFSCFMSREMEFDADRYATRLVGPKTFESMHDSVLELSLAQHQAMADLGNFWDEGRLADDFANWVAHRCKTMPDDVREKLHDKADAEETGVFDTHPSSKDRIASAYAENTKGILKIGNSVPASVLFRSYDKLTKRVSLDFYCELIGKKVKSDQLHSIDELRERHESERASMKALNRYFQAQLHPTRPIPLSEHATEEPADAKVARDAMRQARTDMLDELLDYQRFLKRLDRYEDRMFDAVRASALIQAGFRVNPDDFGLKASSKRHARDVVDDYRDRLDGLDEELEVFESLAARRMGNALQLLMMDKVVAKIEDGEELREEVRALVPEAGFIADIIDHIPTLLLPYTATITLYVAFTEHDDDRRLFKELMNRMDTVYRRLREIRRELGNQPYPLDHADEDMTMRKYVIPTLPDKENLGEIMECTGSVLSQLGTVQQRLFARLALAAEKVEAIFGMEPLPEVEEEDDDEEEE